MGAVDKIFQSQITPFLTVPIVELTRILPYVRSKKIAPAYMGAILWGSNKAEVDSPFISSCNFFLFFLPDHTCSELREGLAIK